MEYALYQDSERTMLIKRDGGIVYNGQKDKQPLREIFEDYGVLRKRSVITLIPSTMHEEEIHTLRHTLYKAGIHDEIILPLNIALSQGETCLVITSTADLCDISVVRNGQIIAGGSITSLERELFHVLADHLTNALHVSVSPDVIRDAKSEIQTFLPNDTRQFFLSAITLTNHEQENFTLDGTLFYNLASPVYAKFISAVKKILRKVSPEHLAELKPCPVILFGSTFTAPGAIQFIKNELGREARVLTIQDATQRIVKVMSHK